MLIKNTHKEPREFLKTLFVLVLGILMGYYLAASGGHCIAEADSTIQQYTLAPILKNGDTRNVMIVGSKGDIWVYDTSDVHLGKEPILTSKKTLAYLR